MSNCQFIKIYPQNPNPREISQVVEVLKHGGVIIYPTDTVYGIGCDITNTKAVERIIKIKGLKSKEAQFSFICYDLSQVAEYAKVDNATFKLMKKNLPGPFTFILPGLNRVPEYFISRRKTVGVRIPNNNITLAIVSQLGKPILTTSAKDIDPLVEYTTDPEQLFENYKQVVDLVIDGGYSGNVPSTIVDCTGSSIEVQRGSADDLRM